MQMNAYDALLAHVKQTNALGQIGALLSWDQEVMMPPNGAAARAEQAAALEAVAHERKTDRRIEDWLDALDGASLNDTQSANIRLIRRSYERSRKIPGKLAEELVRVTAQARQIWVDARSNNCFADFAPTLTEIIELKRQEASCLAGDGGSRYDALLGDFEPGMTVAVLQPLLEKLRPRLSALRQRISESKMDQPVLQGSFDADTQLKLARKLADVVGYNWQSGRLDISIHPFSSGTGDDARITTRVDTAEPFGCLYSTMHELGHALYEQGIPQSQALAPVTHHVSLGVHESQSRLWENQIARSRPFCEWFYPHFQAAFGDCGVCNPEMLYRAVNRVETGFIRTEADEVHYNLHVLLRFELERELIGGELSVTDLENEWNRRFERDFGLAVPNAANGVLQDAHWSIGLFGYFPTYSLGNIYAGQLYPVIRDAVKDFDGQLAVGETDGVLQWLQENVHQHGSLYEPATLMERASGSTVSEAPLLDYLEAKYADLFEL